MASLETIRKAVTELGGRGRGHAYPKGLRAEIIEYARTRRAAGITLEALGVELGMPWRTIARWLPAVRAKRFRRIEIVDARREVVVQGPHGLRIEGLDLEGVAELLRRLG